MFSDPLICLLLTALIAHLLGSFNSAIVFSRLFLHRDIRTIGSGNAGFTNSMRTGNKKISVLTLICDVLKVGIAVLIGGMLMKHCLDGEVGSRELGAYVSGFFAMLGHIFPVYFGFRGGKGVLTLCAMLLFTDWRVALICLATWGILLFFTRMVSLSVLITLPVYILTAFLLRPEGDLLLFGVNIPVGLLTVGTAVLMSVIVAVKHHSNIKRILAGNENKIGQKTVLPEEKEEEAHEE